MILQKSFKHADLSSRNIYMLNMLKDPVCVSYLWCSKIYWLKLDNRKVMLIVTIYQPFYATLVNHVEHFLSDLL